MKMPALAVVGADHRIIRSTESFRCLYASAEALCEQSPELERVLTGRADIAVVNMGDMSVEIEAVTDATGRRQAMLSLPLDERATTPDPPIDALRDAAEKSPAMVWVKDLDGRYLYANPRYIKDLGTSEDRLRGNTDADLPEAETVDGPRLRYAEDGLQEPLQLEYTVPAIDGRSALAAFRFALRDDTGQPIGTCGVAAPTNEAQVARDEAVRLMQLERWNRLDPVDVRAEVLEQWHVQAAPARSEEELAEEQALEVAKESPADAAVESDPTPEAADEPPSPEADPPQDDVDEAGVADQAAAPSAPGADSNANSAELLQNDLELARKWADRADQLQGDLQQAQARIREAEAQAQQARAAAARTAEEASRWRGELEQARVELEQTRAQLESAEAEAHAARAEVEAVRGELGAARAQAESLRGPSTAALRLSEELGRALAVERDRGDELERTLARLRSRLTDFETALDRSQPSQSLGF
jgi:PAS domain S-box-containing protein